MKIDNLLHYVDNNLDKNILDALCKSNDEDISRYVINVTSDLLQVAFPIEEFKINAINNFKNFSDQEIGEIATYAILIPYVQVNLQNESNWQEKANSFLEMFIAYSINTISKNEFISNLLQMKNLVGISDKFYNGIIIYFTMQHNFIRNSILEHMQ